MKEKVGQLKEAIQKLESRTKKIIIAGVAILIVGAVALALVLNNRPYEVLFSGLSAEEAQQITAKLLEDGVDYRFKDDSTIMVKKDVLDATKAALVQEGYPKSGFTYDTFINNAGMMTTDADKDTYKLYDLQNRIGSTIRLFDGVKDAKVTIALGEESKYALTDENKEKSSASATVIMENGGSPTAEQSAGIQRLIAKSVPGLEMEDVAVFDGNGVDVSEDANSTSNSSDAEEVAQVIEDQIARNVMKVLGPIYGEDNVRVSARAIINMEKLIRETITYNTPEKINDEDKTGIVSKEDLYNERSNTGNAAQGIAGTDSNSDTPQYNTDGDTDGAAASSESVSREYLVNQIKEQGQVDPGALDDLTVSVAINGKGFGSLRESQIISLVANAAGISAEDQETKISVASAPFYEEDDGKDEKKGGLADVKVLGIPLIYLLIAAAVLAIIITVIVFIILRKKRDKAEEEELQEQLVFVPENNDEVVKDLNQELQEMQNDRAMELKKSVRDFAEENAELSAQLLKTWLNGGGGDGE